MLYPTARQAAIAVAGSHASRVTDWEEYVKKLIRRKTIALRRDPNRPGFYGRWLVIEAKDWFAVRSLGRSKKDPNRLVGVVVAGPAKTKKGILDQLGVARTTKGGPHRKGIYYAYREDEQFVIGQGRILTQRYNLQLEHEEL